ncbi:hypothetical protein Fcan01_11312 [Folsomia candida]|uniref:Uncharacterized protein n=1 Tax=Folsomia candida TaxID=158441 RepID=A0A226EDS7_FOLCA|nr:hypothetical protein Fcan01_11312 [Folsomia candida]
MCEKDVDEFCKTRQLRLNHMVDSNVRRRLIRLSHLLESICRSKDAIGIVKDVEALRKIDPLNGKITPSDFKKFLGQLNDEIYTSFIKYFFDKRDDVDEDISDSSASGDPNDSSRMVERKGQIPGLRAKDQFMVLDDLPPEKICSSSNICSGTTMSMTPDRFAEVEELEDGTTSASSSPIYTGTTISMTPASPFHKENTNFGFSGLDGRGVKRETDNFWNFKNQGEESEYESHEVGVESNPSCHLQDNNPITPLELCQIKGIDPSLLDYKLPKNVTLFIPRTEWSKFYDADRGIPINNYGQLIHDALQEQHGIPCSFIARGKTAISARNSKFCASFRGVCGSSRYHQEDPDVCKQDLQHKTALSSKISEYSKLQHLQFLHKNLPTRSLAVSRKIKSEGNLQGGHRGKNMVVALHDVEQKLKLNTRFQDARFPDLSGFIKSNVVSPHRMTLFYSPAQLRFAKGCDEIYFDATGKIVPGEVIDETTGEIKQLLLHSAVAKLSKSKNVPAIPIMEALSTKGDVPAIANFLLQLVADVRKYKLSWQPRLFVVDMCLAYLHASVLALNKESLAVYINRIYDYLIGDYPKIAVPKTVIFVCSNHLMHAVSRYLHKKAVNKSTIKMAMFGFAQLVELYQKEDFENICTSLICLFEDKYLPPAISQMYVDKLSGKMLAPDSRVEDYEMCVHDDEAMQQMFPSPDPQLQREKSKFFLYFRNRREKLRAQRMSVMQDGQESVVNKFYSATVIQTFERWITYYPFWGKVGFTLTGDIPEETITTASCESYFKDQKHSFHTTKQFKPDFIEEHALIVANMLDRALLLNGLKSIKSNKTKLSIKNYENEESTVVPQAQQKAGSLEYSTAKWKRRSRNSTPSYKTIIHTSKQNMRQIRSGSPFEHEFKSNTDHKSEISKSSEFTSGIHQKSVSCPVKPTSSITGPINGPQSNTRKIKDRAKNIEGQHQNDGTIRSDSTREIVDLTQTEDELPMMDPLKISSREWVLETEALVVFDETTFGFSGVESEILSLKFNTFVTSGIAMSYAYRLMLEFVPNYQTQKKIKLVSSDLIYHTNQNELPGCVPIFNQNPDFLPDESSFDKDDGKIYTIIFFRQHAFLVEIDFDSVTINFLDSLETYTDALERTAIFNALEAVLERKYSLDSWTEVNKKSVQQYYNDCVIFSLMNMRMRLLGLDLDQLWDSQDSGWMNQV